MIPGNTDVTRYYVMPEISVTLAVRFRAIKSPNRCKDTAFFCWQMIFRDFFLIFVPNKTKYNNT